MKKLAVFLTGITAVLIILTYTRGTAKEPVPSVCEYQFSATAADGSCFCMWNGVEGSFCGCPGC